MSSKQRQRDYERKRQAAWAQRQQDRQARRRRSVQIVAVVIALAMVGTLAVALLASGPPQQPPADATPPGSETPSQQQSPDEVVGPTEAPDPSVAENRTWQAVVTTNRGEVGLELDGTVAPLAVASFVTLTRAGFFDGTACHRLTVAGIFVLQCGDPTGTGGGGPAYRFGPIENAPADGRYPAGTLAMARVGHDAHSNGSQFFLVYEDSQIPSDSAGGYTVFGRVTHGLDIIRDVAAGGVDAGGVAPALEVTIDRIEAR